MKIIFADIVYVSAIVLFLTLLSFIHYSIRNDIRKLELKVATIEGVLWNPNN